MTQPHLQRALVLFEQGRGELAEPELRGALSADPNQPLAHALLALCLAEQKKFAEATAEAKTAIHLAPELASAHYAHARVLQQRNRLAEALAAVEVAILLDPVDADHFALLAQIRLDRRNWPAALEAAERGLALDPEDVTCTNLRAIALVQLGRRAEAGATIGAALSRQPENAVTHANLGWTLLHAGQPKQAMEHFREALRLDPNSDWARSGIVEALKARHFVYRWMLAYFLWMNRLGSRAQWGLIIGGFIGYQVLLELARDRPELAPWILPLIAGYFVFAMLSWLAYPFFNLLLRLNRFGRLALSRDQIVGSNWVGGGLLVAFAAFAAAVIAWNVAGVFLGMMCLLWVLPLSAVHRMPVGWPRRAMAVYTFILAVVGILSLVPVFLVASMSEEAFETLLKDPDNRWLPPLFVLCHYCRTPFLLGAFCSTFVAGYLSGVRPKR